MITVEANCTDCKAHISKTWTDPDWAAINAYIADPGKCDGCKADMWLDCE